MAVLDGDPQDSGGVGPNSSLQNEETSEISMRQIHPLGTNIVIGPIYWCKNEPDVTVSESPNAAMTLMSAAFTSSTRGKRKT